MPIMVAKSATTFLVSLLARSLSRFYRYAPLECTNICRSSKLEASRRCSENKLFVVLQISGSLIPSSRADCVVCGSSEGSSISWVRSLGDLVRVRSVLCGRIDGRASVEHDYCEG